MDEMMEREEPVTRDEVNRLWAEVHMLRALVVMDVARRWDEPRIEEWFDRITERLDAGAARDESSLANFQRALGLLAADVKAAVPRPPAPPA